MIYSAILLLASQAAAHMIMKTPAPFGNPDNSPLSSSGANFPCKLTGDPATFYSGVTATEMAVGTDQTLSFSGSAVHGGGSCQLAITSDTAPTKSSQWQVILSIEGGCPSKDGSGPSEYTFQIPSSVPSGDYTFAWTWISKLAGQPEFYMNCAPIKVTGGAAKRDDLAIAARSDLPGLFVANMGELNDCKTVPGTDPVFPNPGKVEKPGSSNNFADVKGNCIAPGTSAGGSGTGDSGNSGNSGSSAAPEAPAPTPAPEAPASTPAPAAGGGGDKALPPANPTMGFVTVSKPAAAPAPTSSAAPAPAPAPTSSSPSSSPTGTTPPPVVGGAGALSGACTQEGMFNCPNGSTYQQCASGQWTALQAMPGGTTCTVGQTAGLWARGGIRGGRVVRRSQISV